MTTMKERIARAIYQKFEDRPLYAQKQMNGIIADELADAALAELREPTEAMIAARFNVLGNGGQIEWQAMIDAARTEEPQ